MQGLSVVSRTGARLLDLLGLGAGVLLGDVEKASISCRHELDLDGSSFGHVVVLHKAKGAVDSPAPEFGRNLRIYRRLSSWLSVRLASAEAVHAVGPLQAHDCALDGGEHGQGQDDGEGDEGVEIDRRIDVPSHVHMHHQGDQDMADDHDGDIGREIVGAVQVELLTADIALAGDLEVGAEHLALAAMGALAQRAAPHRLTNVTLLGCLGSSCHHITSSCDPWVHKT